MDKGFRLSVLLAIVFLFLMFLPAACFAKVVYVKTTGSDINSGLSWSLAKKTVKAGLKTAISGDQVWVMKGTYVENITLKLGVALYGGFYGTETLLSQRNWTTNITILDGNKNGSVVTSPENATVSTRIDGFTIRNGSGIAVYGYTVGGGIYCTNSAPRISNNRIADNNATFGGGIYCDSVSPVILNNTITGNIAQDEGGGICFDYGSPTISNNIITGNSAQGRGGGGMYFYGSSPTISNNIIANNSTVTEGGGIFCDEGSPIISNNTIADNRADDGTGGIYCSNYSSPEILNCIVAYNLSGIYAYCGYDCTPVLKNNCVYNPNGFNYTGTVPGTGDIQADPLFENRTGGDYHLSASSPCINRGDNSVVATGSLDIDGKARISGVKVDIGADEYVCSVPKITAQPTSRTVNIGLSTTFTITATGAKNYQWRKGSTNITGATKSAYTISSVTTSNAGSYNCVVSSDCGSVMSSSATLTINPKPAITTHPVSQTKTVGSSVTFTVAATGTAPLSYRWRKNNTSIIGATKTIYSIASVTTASVGSYNCVVSNLSGSATSNTALLAIGTKPTISTQPVSQTKAAGATATFTVAATGTAPLSYQWRKTAVNITGATNSSYVISPIATSHAGSYSCVVSNVCGSVTSNAAALTVSGSIPIITTQPVSQTKAVGSSVTFSIKVTGTTPFRYQWKKAGISLLGATGTAYTMSNIQTSKAGSYTCVVSNTYGSATSNAAILTVTSGGPPPPP